MAINGLNESRRFAFSLTNKDLPVFGVAQLEGTEAISQLYRFDLMLVSESADVDFDAVLQDTATLTIFSHDGVHSHEYHGVIVEFEQLSKVNKLVFYRAVLVPRLSLLDLNKITEIYGNETSLPKIIEQVLKENELTTNDYDFNLEDESAYRQRTFVCQYDETSRNFISRLMESAGMYYFFNHDDRDQEKLIIVDYKKAHPDQVLKLSYCAPEDLQTQFQDKNIVSFLCTQRRLPEAAMIKDFNYRKASVGVFEVNETVSDKGSGLMMFHGNNLRTDAEASALAKIRAQELRCHGTIFSGDATAVGVRSGHFIELSDHYLDRFNSQYLVTEVHHLGSQEQLLFQDTTNRIQSKKERLNYGTNYQCSFKAIPRDVQYRAQRLTPKPVIAGVISARIDAEGKGDFVEIDEFGQYKVQFLLDRNKKNPTKGSAYLRMASPSAGKTSGMHFPLLKGTEVLIAFSGGDPDCPVIMGAVPDSVNRSVVESANHFYSQIKTPSGNRLTFSDETNKAGFELSVPGVMRMGSFDGKGTGVADTSSVQNPLAKPAPPAYKFYKGPTYDFNANSKTAFTVGASHVFSANLINEAKLNFGTEIKGGISSSLKLGFEIEFKTDLSDKYEIDLAKKVSKDVNANSSNFYNATQFRATAGELAAEPLNVVNEGLTAKAKDAAYVALFFQMAATSLTVSTAIKANLDADVSNPDVPFWGGTGGNYWSSWSTALVDGLSLVSLATAFVVGFIMSGNKRQTPQRHKNFLNIDHNTGIMMGVQSDNLGIIGSEGSWYLQNKGLVDIGCSDDVKFNGSLTTIALHPNKVPGRLSIEKDGVKLVGGQKGIENLVYRGAFTVKVAGVKIPRVQLDANNSFLRHPDGTNYGLEMQAGRVKLSLDAATDLDLSAGMVKLRKGRSTSLALKADSATLGAQNINLAAKCVNIVGATFQLGQAKIGELTCLIGDVSTTLTAQAKEAADSTKATMESMTNDAKQKAEALTGELASEVLKVKMDLEQETAELKSQVADLKDQVNRLRR
jgi:type VI secretion system VgrG family protein